MKWFTSLSISNRLIFNIIFAVLCIVTTTYFYIHDKRETLIEDRKHELEVLVKSTRSLVKSYHEQYRRGELSEIEAKQAAIKAVDILRFSESGYFMLVDPQGTMINHPIKKSMNGQDIRGLKDVNGKLFMIDAIETAQQPGGGFHEYMWPKPGSDEAVRKLTGVFMFEPWNWIISTGMYLDDIDEIFWQDSIRSLSIVGLIALVMISISTLTANSIIKPINAMAEQFKHVSENHDLSVKLPENGAGELNMLAHEFNQLIQSFNTSLTKVQLAAKELVSHSQLLSEASEEIARGSNQQNDATNSIAATVEEFSASVDSLAKNADHMRQFSNETGMQSQHGSAAMNETVQHMHDMASSVRGSSSIIGELGTLSENIQDIINVIQIVAEQTNLLALNAAIEAARAGEQGRGFAVVADEVRQLAARTAESSGQISGTIGEIQNYTRRAIENMEQGVTKVDEGLERVGKADDLIRNVQASSSDLGNIIDQVSTALTEQTNASNEMAVRVSDIAQMAETNSQFASQTQRSIKELYALSENLEKNAAGFKLSQCQESLQLA